MKNSKKKFVIDKLLASPPPNSVVLSFDEKGKTPHGIRIMKESIIDFMIGKMPIYSSIILNGY